MKHRVSRAYRAVAALLVCVFTITGSGLDLRALASFGSSSRSSVGRLMPWSLSAYAQAPPPTPSVTVFGPQTFSRAGANETFTAAVAVPSGVMAPFTLHVQNGDASGDHRVSS